MFLSCSFKIYVTHENDFVFTGTRQIYFDLQNDSSMNPRVGENATLKGIFNHKTVRKQLLLLKTVARKSY